MMQASFRYLNKTCIPLSKENEHIHPSMKPTLVWPNQYFMLIPCTDCVLAKLEYTVHIEMQQWFTSDEQ